MSALADLKRRLAERRNGGSTMRYNPFNLFSAKVEAIEPLPGDEDNTRLYNVTRYTYLRPQRSGDDAAAPLSLTMWERREASGTRASDFSVAHSDGVDNTGIFHWPAEEVLAHLMLGPWATEHGECEPESRGVLELGCGVALAGFAFAAAFPLSRVWVTDGNRGVVSVAQANAVKIFGDSAEARVHARQLLWHDCEWMFEPQPSREGGPSAQAVIDDVDLIVGADCLFFDQYHDALVTLLARALRRPRHDGSRRPPLEVRLVAPTRGTTLQRFVDKMSATGPDIVVEVVERHDDYIAQVHREQCVDAASTGYCADRHYPLLVKVMSSVGESGAA